MTWLPKYQLPDLGGDLVAGLSVAFTIIPQALALATLAGLPANYGLYSSFMGCFMYALFGTCKDAAVGPTSILAILVAPYVVLGGPVYAILLSFFSGVLMLFAGMLNLGFVVDFISFPVISSFTSASAITIAVSQFKGFLGLHFTAPKLTQAIMAVIHSVRSVNLWDFSLGLLSLTFLLTVQAAKDSRFHLDNHFLARSLNALWWVLVTGRNAIVVIGAASIAYLTARWSAFTLTSPITLGLPEFEAPQFILMDRNSTMVADFPQVFSEIIPGVFVLALIELMETVAVAKAFRPGKKLDSTQEMIAIGLSNLSGSFFGAFPVSGSFSRSAVNHNSGVRSPLGGVVTGSLVLLALATLAPFFELIPQTALSSIIIAAVVPMIKFSDCLVIWRSNKLDLIPYVATLLSCILLGLEFGILIGVNVSVGILLYQQARPRVTVAIRMTPDGHNFLYIKPDRSVFFPSTEYMKVKVDKALEDVKGSECRTLVIDGEHMFRADSTFGMGMKNFVECLSAQQIQVLFYNLRKPVLRSVKGSSRHSSTDFICCRSELEVFAHITSFRFRDETNVPQLSSNREWVSRSQEFPPSADTSI